jgi:hypothetical protein
MADMLVWGGGVKCGAAFGSGDEEDRWGFDGVIVGEWLGGVSKRVC